jgi:hypothetical protein
LFISYVVRINTFRAIRFRSSQFLSYHFYYLITMFSVMLFQLPCSNYPVNDQLLYYTSEYVYLLPYMIHYVHTFNQLSYVITTLTLSSFLFIRIYTNTQYTSYFYYDSIFISIYSINIIRNICPHTTINLFDTLSLLKDSYFSYRICFPLVTIHSKYSITHPLSFILLLQLLIRSRFT